MVGSTQVEGGGVDQISIYIKDKGNQVPCCWKKLHI